MLHLPSFCSFIILKIEIHVPIPFINLHYLVQLDCNYLSTDNYKKSYREQSNLVETIFN